MKTPIQAFLRHSTLRELHNDNRGVTTVEYVIVLVLIAVVSITAWQTFGGTVMSKIKGSDDKVRDGVVF